MKGFPFDKLYLELPLCQARLQPSLSYCARRPGIEYIGVQDGDGRVSELLRALPLTGEDFEELNLLAYILVRLSGGEDQLFLNNKKQPFLMQELERRIAEEECSTLSDLIDLAYDVGAGSEYPAQHYKKDHFEQLLARERERYLPCLDMRLPEPPAELWLAEMTEGKQYWLSGIDQFSARQLVIRQANSLLICQAWLNADKSVRFSEECGGPSVYTWLKDIQLSHALKELGELFDFEKMEQDEGEVNGLHYMIVESNQLPMDYLASIAQ